MTRHCLRSTEKFLKLCVSEGLFLTMDNYIETLNSIGDSLIKWADPEEIVTGYTKVKIRRRGFFPKSFLLQHETKPCVF